MSRPLQPQPQGAPLPGMRNGAPWEGMSPSGVPYVAANFYVYENDIPNPQGTVTSLPANGAATLTFNIAGDSDFFWTKFSAYALVGGAATTRSADQLPGVTMLLTNTTNGRQYSTNPVPLPNMAGNGQFPFILPQVVLWQAFATIQVQLSNLTSTAYSNLNLSFIGVKAFSGQTTSP